MWLFLLLLLPLVLIGWRRPRGPFRYVHNQLVQLIQGLFREVGLHKSNVNGDAELGMTPAAGHKLAQL